ncbi:hypothetical protein ScPMuIL_010728 [Solemya velum]
MVDLTAHAVKDVLKSTKLVYIGVYHLFQYDPSIASNRLCHYDLKYRFQLSVSLRTQVSLPIVCATTISSITSNCLFHYDPKYHYSVSAGELQGSRQRAPNNRTVAYTKLHRDVVARRHKRGMDLPPCSGGKVDGVQLKQITVVTSDDDLKPPPYSDQVSFANGSVACNNKEELNDTTLPTKSQSVNMSSKGISSESIPKTVSQTQAQTQLLVNQSSLRRRHKSDGCLPPNKSDLLDPNHRKSSWCDSRSTLNGAKFDDSFIDEYGTTLIYSRHEKVPLKDFSNEVRASKDVQRFLDNTVLLLDLNKSGMDEIINEILHKMLDSTESQISFDQSRTALFTHDFVHQMSRTLQCTSISEGGGFDYDQNWICCMASIPSIQTRHVGIARLHRAANLGMTCQEVYFVIVILTPTKEKGTKNELETGRTFATVFSDLNMRLDLLDVDTEDEFKAILAQHAKELAEKQKTSDVKIPLDDDDKDEGSCKCRFLNGIRMDLRRRLPHYISDYKDGIIGPKSLQKTIATTLFLYFACLMPSIAFGVLNSDNTHGVLNVEKVLYSQMFGGLLFAVFGGTPQIVLLTTAPLALYTKIIYSISEDFGLDFSSMFACVGLWNSFFLFVYSAFDLSVLMKWSTRSSEEIFALFISIAFCVDAFKDTAKNFQMHYNSAACSGSIMSTLQNASEVLSNLTSNSSAEISNQSLLNTSTDVSPLGAPAVCERDVSTLYLLLLLGMLWLGVTIYNFTKTPYLNAGKREILADYALPVSVIVMSVVGAYFFRDVNLGKSFSGETSDNPFQLIPVQNLQLGAVFGAMGLGFCLSLLFFMDQNISAALVNAPQNKMKKGTAYHWDLLIVGVINALLSLVGFPWVHAALPHSPLHVRALADVEERVDQGHIYQIIVKVRETRLTAIFSHILIGLSLLIMPYLAYIPTPVLYGLFLYVGVTAVDDNQLFERIMLLITEQNAYPPNHYIRRVPQRKIHIFTLLQLLQLIVLCGFGFAPYPYLKMFFPVLIFLLIPLRHKIIPKVIEQKYLKAMDGH